MESVLGPLEQKHKFSEMYPNALFMDTVPDPPEHENSASMLRGMMHWNALRDPQILPKANNRSSV
jgi:hypothetical protein